MLNEQEMKKVVSYWLKTAELKWETAKTLKKAAKYADSLFFCHLVLESLLKALVCLKTKEIPPYLHELDRLAELTGLDLTENQRRLLAEVNSFNIRARYDDYKMKFYKKATKTYAERFFGFVETMIVWLKQHITDRL